MPTPPRRHPTLLSLRWFQFSFRDLIWFTLVMAALAFGVARYEMGHREAVYQITQQLTYTTSHTAGLYWKVPVFHNRKLESVWHIEKDSGFMKRKGEDGDRQLIISHPTPGCSSSYHTASKLQAPNMFYMTSHDEDDLFEDYAQNIRNTPRHHIRPIFWMVLSISVLAILVALAGYEVGERHMRAKMSTYRGD